MGERECGKWVLQSFCGDEMGGGRRAVRCDGEAGVTPLFPYVLHRLCFVGISMGEHLVPAASLFVSSSVAVPSELSRYENLTSTGYCSLIGHERERNERCGLTPISNNNTVDNRCLQKNPLCPSVTSRRCFSLPSPTLFMSKK